MSAPFVDPQDVARSAHGNALFVNLMHFARTLRAAGMNIGSGKILECLNAVEAVGVERRDDFYWTLHAVLVTKASDREVFDQAFHVFWRNPNLLERAFGMTLPPLASGEAQPEALQRRVAEAMASRMPDFSTDSRQDDELQEESSAGWSASEQLRQRDFEGMSAEELALAKQAISKLAVRLKQVKSRRHQPCSSGNRVDLRRTLRRSLRGGGRFSALERTKVRLEPPPLVLICDISGSMSRYSRICLHFAHALSERFSRVYAFVFGTRLTHVSRHLRDKDVDVALSRIGHDAQDWDGGTRIGECIRHFNVAWSRRVLRHGATVALITDGLDRDAGYGLAKEMERLQKSCSRLICLNPLLRYDGYEPRARGMQAILPYVDRLSSVHNLESLEQLAKALAE